MPTMNVVAECTWSLEPDQTSASVYVPAAILDRYVSVALDPALPRELSHGEWYADLALFPGVWATGASPKKCLDTLQEVLREWLILKIADRDRDIPVIDEIDLSVCF
jgi:predicted RNase H-like HicB family nuclease